MKRRDFLKAGAAGVVGTIAGATTLFTWSPRAYSANIAVTLNIVAGNVPMIDGTLAYMFGFSSSGTAGFPGPTIICQAGDTISLTLVNTLNTKSSFSVPGTSINTIVNGGSNVSFSFAAPAAGTYLYHDALNGGVNRVMGLNGALIVMPAGLSKQSFVGGPSFFRQYKWVLGNVDTVWGEAVRANGHNYVTNPALSVSTFKPRYFTINGQSYEDTHLNSNTDLKGNFGEAAMVRMVNAGMVTHSPHFHGNHVSVVSINRKNFAAPFKQKDVVSMFPLDCRDVIYPFEAPPDAWPASLAGPGTKHFFPMHCHSEPSQTAGGGSYPHGLHTGITIGEAPLQEPVL